jgi:hypothetical protein
VVAVTVADRVGVVADSVVVPVWVFDVVVVGAAAAVAVFASVVVLASLRDVDGDVVVSLSAAVVDGAVALVVTDAFVVRLFICCVRLVAMLWPAPEPQPAMTMARKPTRATCESTDRLDLPVRIDLPIRIDPAYPQDGASVGAPMNETARSPPIHLGEFASAAVCQRSRGRRLRGGHGGLRPVAWLAVAGERNR